MNKLLINFKTGYDLIDEFDDEDIVGLIKYWMKKKNVIEVSIRHGRDKNGELYESVIKKVTRI